MTEFFFSFAVNFTSRSLIFLETYINKSPLRSRWTNKSVCTSVQIRAASSSLVTHDLFLSFSREIGIRGMCARRYLFDFSKGETNLNCRSRAIPVPSFTFPETRLPSVPLRSLFLSLPSSFFPSRCGFFHVVVLCTYPSRLTSRTSSLFFLLRRTQCGWRAAICGRDSRCFWTRRGRRGRAEIERILAGCAVKGKSKRQIRRSILVEREAIPFTDKITDESDTSGREAAQSAFCSCVFLLYFHATAGRLMHKENSLSLPR